MAEPAPPRCPNLHLARVPNWCVKALKPNERHYHVRDYRSFSILLHRMDIAVSSDDGLGFHALVRADCSTFYVDGERAARLYEYLERVWSLPTEDPDDSCRDGSPHWVGGVRRGEWRTWRRACKTLISAFQVYTIIGASQPAERSALFDCPRPAK